MPAPEVANAASPWPYLPTLLRLVLAVGCGLFVGLEREHQGKAGVRTFGLAALLGCLGGLAGDRLATLAMVCLLVLVGLMNWRQFTLHQTLALTTSTALLLVGFAGVFCGQGHTFTPVAVTVITAALLAWKQPISGFVVGLSDLELRSAILLAILSFLIYPVLPARAVDPWGLIEPQGTWATVLLVAALGFVNYVLWKRYGPRGIEITSFLGGLVNSTAAVAELAQRVKEGGAGLLAVAYRGTLLATTAMLVGNSLLLAILAWPAWVGSLAPLALMVCTSVLFVWKSLKDRPGGPGDPEAGPGATLFAGGSPKVRVDLSGVARRGNACPETPWELGVLCRERCGGAWPPVLRPWPRPAPRLPRMGPYWHR
jgi:hypothetical protein